MRENNPSRSCGRRNPARGPIFKCPGFGQRAGPAAPARMVPFGLVRIFKRGKQGIYWAQLHGQRVSLHTIDRTAAELAFKDLQRRAIDPTYRPASNATLEDALVAFRDQQAERGRAPGTRAQYEVHFGHMARVLGLRMPLAALDAAQVDRYLSTRHAERAASTTRWKELCTLRGALKLARRHKLYPHPLDEVMPTDFDGRTSTPGSRHLLMPGVKKLLAVLPEPRAAVVCYLVATGADWQSVELARKADVNFRTGLVTVHGSKTETRQRTIPILKVFEGLLQRAVRSMPFAPWDSVRRDLEVACRRAKVERVTPRDLRRSTGRILRAAGVDPQLIGPMLGHADGRMVELVYGRLEPKELGSLIAKQSAGTKTVRKRAKKPASESKSSRKTRAA